MKTWWREFLQLNKRERRGTLLLCVIVVFEILVLSLRQRQQPEATQDFAAFEEQIDAFLQQDPLDLAAAGFHVDTASQQELFPFNPNQLPVEDWQRLGLSAKQAQSIHNFEAAGGRFRKKEDVARMYVVDSSLYAQLEPWIEIPDSMRRTNRSFTHHATLPETVTVSQTFSRDSTWNVAAREPTLKVAIAMNKADSAGWKLLRGIGPAYAARTCDSRALDGGNADGIPVRIAVV